MTYIRWSSNLSCLSRHDLDGTDLRVEQVTDALEVDLDVGHADGELDRGGRRLHAAEHIVQQTRDDALQLPVLMKQQTGGSE